MKRSLEPVVKQIKLKKEKLESLKRENFLSNALKDFFHTEIIYTSSDIGGKRLSHLQAKEMVRQYPKFKHIGPDNKTLLQAKGQKIALEFIEKFARQKNPIDIYVIRNLHKIIMQEAWPEIGGQYRQENMEIKRSSIQTPHYSKVPEEMFFLNQYLLETQKGLADDDILGICELLTNVRHKLAWIHPFRDGNGRVARFALNLIARRYNLPYILTPTTKISDRMWQAIQKADKGDLTDLTQLNLELLEESFDIVLKYWQDGAIKGLKHPSRRKKLQDYLE